MQVNPPFLRILHVIASLDPKAGGPPNVLTRLAAGQASLGHSVQTLSYGDENSMQRLGRDLASVPGQLLLVHHLLPPPGRLERRLGSQARSKAGQLVSAIDVIHLHGIWEPLLRHAANAAWASRKPYWVAPHGMLDPWSLAQKKWKKRLALAMGYRAMLNHATALHVLNADEDRLLAPLRLKCPNTLLPNGIYLSEVNPLPPAGSFRARHPELGNHPFILFLGRLHFKKGLDYLASAFSIVAKQNADVRLVVAGPEDGAQSGFERAIAEAGLKDRVRIVGPLYGAQKLEVLADATLFCLPSRQEGFSIAIAEAMACGVPPVISPECHFPEVEAAGAGLVAPLDAEQIAAAILHILNNADDHARMAAKGKTLIEQHYTWERLAKRSVEMYQRALTRDTAA